MDHMKILIVRHGDPDYSIDGLTPKGQREAKLLSDRLCREDITALYCSTMGRAKLTAEPTLEKKGITAEYCDWLREFGNPQIQLPYLENTKACWDILPGFLDTCPNIYSPTDWRNVNFIKNSDVPAAYDEVCGEFDAALARHGYRREGTCYKAEQPNHDTLVFVCHFGLSSVLISHLLNCSPYSIWQNCFTPPTSVTTFYSEERIEGIAAFRCSGLGDVSHLYLADEEISFSGRFCECFTDNTRHH